MPPGRPLFAFLLAFLTILPQDGQAHFQDAETEVLTALSKIATYLLSFRPSLLRFSPPALLPT